MSLFLKWIRCLGLALTIYSMAIAPFAGADTSKSKSGDNNYESISLFTSAAQRQSLDRLRKLTSDQAAYIVSDLGEHGVRKNSIKNEKLVFKGFIRRASVTPEIMLQTADKNWLSKREWQEIAEPVESGVRIKQRSKQFILKPGQTIQ